MCLAGMSFEKINVQRSQQVCGHRPPPGARPPKEGQKRSDKAIANRDPARIARRKTG